MKLPYIALAATLWLGGGALALAEPTPVPAPVQALPAVPAIPPGVLDNPYVKSILDSIGGLFQTTNGNSANGKVTFYRRFDLQVETAPNVYRAVHLHQGTVINPRGTTLSPGMAVVVNGAAQRDGSLNADTITVR